MQELMMEAGRRQNALSNITTGEIIRRVCHVLPLPDLKNMHEVSRKCETSAICRGPCNDKKGCRKISHAEWLW